MRKQLGMAFEDQRGVSELVKSLVQRPDRLSDQHGAIPTRVSLIYFNAGGGHRAAATALQSELARQCPNWVVSLVDLFAILDPQQRFKRMTGFAPETYYNKRLSTGFTLGLAQELKLLQAMIRMANVQLVAKLKAYWHMTEPDLVVSLVPNFNRAIGQSIKQARPQVPFVTVMTDLADYPPHFWVEPGYTEHLVCGTEYAVQQALSRGISHSLVHQVSGMLLSPRFYDQSDQDRAAARGELGFKPHDEVGLVMFGGHGSVSMKRIARQLRDRPLILICGRNESLKASLANLSPNATHHVLGYTPDVARYMRLADYFIGKPGPGSMSEALHCGLPVIVARNAWTMPQERWNTDWVQSQGLGCVLPSLANINQAVHELLGKRTDFRSNVAQLTNRALFEVPVVLRTVLAKHDQMSSGCEVASQ